jgi:hypothetical protein
MHWVVLSMSGWPLHLGSDRRSCWPWRPCIPLSQGKAQNAGSCSTSHEPDGDTNPVIYPLRRSESVRVVREIRMLGARWRQLAPASWHGLRHRHRAKAAGNRSSPCLKSPPQVSTLPAASGLLVAASRDGLSAPSRPELLTRQLGAFGHGPHLCPADVWVLTSDSV